MKHINFLSNLVAKNEVNRALAAEKNEVNRALAAEKNEVNRALAAEKVLQNIGGVLRGIKP